MFSKFGFSGKSDIFIRLGDGFGKGLFIFFATSGTILLSFGSAFAGSFDLNKSWGEVSGIPDSMSFILFNPYSVLGFGALLFLLGAIGTYQDQGKQNKRMDELSVENQKHAETKSALNTAQEEVQETKSKLIEKHNELVTTFLKGVFRQLDLNTHARVSLYYEHDEEFYILARYSANPTYSKIHRQKFPLNQGVISKAWQHNCHEENNCPSASADFNAYRQYLKDTYSYEIDKINALAMNSCRYYAKAIVDADVHIGVIVFESTQTDFLEGTLKVDVNTYCESHQGQISKFVRDSLNFDKEVTIKRSGVQLSVEDDLLEVLGGGS
ncbi:hypothetical protein [Pseudoalteromonas sp.]|uniref:hypothetical protein n=1 Tax=Pseudoalteromonas sp. TaxID=53249 RepID=UPI00272AE00F|nr:hypothetical protein [Pseudoalteromonas sp.]